MKKPFSDFANRKPPHKAVAAPASGSGHVPRGGRPQMAQHAAAGRGAGMPSGAPQAGRQRTGGGHALMIGVFALSALVGGGLAGLFLAMQDTVTPVAGNGTGNTSIAIITPNAGTSDSKVAEADSRKATSAPAAAMAAGNGKMDGAGASSGKVQDRVVATAPRPEAPAEAPATSEAGVVAAASELRQLTDQVISALGALGRAEQQGTVEETAAGADNLRNSLADLVDAAIAGGKSDEEIRALVSEALENAGEQNIPAMLRDASGKLDVRRLLASVMPAAPADAMPMSADERAYFSQLEEEAGNEAGGAAAAATTAARPAASGNTRTAGNTRSRSRFFTRNGKRYTIIRPGDTLSDIAYAAYGDVLAYSAILRANRGRISVRNLKPGTRILIPEIATTRNKNRQRRIRRDSAAPAAAGNTRRRTATDNRRNRQPATNAGRPQPKIITLPAAGNAAEAKDGTVRKITNFRSRRQSEPLDIVPAPAAR